jgi:site-specific DNA-methyltransferase (adenine-specific)
MRKDPSINLHLGCSLQAMREMEDNQYDLAIVDPPYGIERLSKITLKGSGKLKNRALNTDTKIQRWDTAPSPEYFEELFRVSKQQIVWGGNYFDLPPTRCVIAWDKVQPWENFSGWEMGWTSFNKPAPLFKFDNRTGGKIHPTQKPIELYKYCLEKFAKDGDKILDTHLGSGSIACACWDLGFDLDAWEIDKDYFEKTTERYTQYSKQSKLF